MQMPSIHSKNQRALYNGISSSYLRSPNNWETSPKIVSFLRANLKTSMSFLKRRIGEGGRSLELLHNLKMKPVNKMHRIRNNHMVERPRTLIRKMPRILHGDPKCMMMKKLISKTSSKRKSRRSLSKKNEMLKWRANSLKTSYNAKRMK